MNIFSKQSDRPGFTLIEAIIGIGIFIIIAVGVYEISISTSRLIQSSRLIIVSAAVANEQFEIIHNIPYSAVGTVLGIPSGTLPAEQHVIRDQADFLVKITIRNIDDPFDGRLNGAPNDTSPADYKLVELEISVPDNPRFATQNYTEYIAPKNLENSSTNGALFVRVFNASGQPVPGASVHIANNDVSPLVLIDDVTNNEGNLQIVDALPALVSYQITVTKGGYSQEQTYLANNPANPNPISPHATVLSQQVTQTSFAIDKTGTLNVESVTNTCAPISNVSFSLVGAKLIGTSPDIVKYQDTFNTGASGIKNIPGLEWDTYNLELNDSLYDLSGTISPISFSLAPDSTQNVKIIVSPKNPNSLLVSVESAGTQLPLSGASVKIEKDEFSEELLTGRGFLRQGDWSGGSGQTNFVDPKMYYSSDGNIENSSPAGEIKLKEAFGFYALSGELISSTFDTGSASNFYQLIATPQDQPPETGAGSVLFQLASNNDNATWDFKGPDGTAGTFYSAIDGNISAVHNNDRYLRYRALLSTASTTYTPNIGEISFTFSSLCVPPGQVMFEGLESGNYILTISKSGFQTITENITLDQPTQRREESLMPN